MGRCPRHCRRCCSPSCRRYRCCTPRSRRTGDDTSRPPLRKSLRRSDRRCFAWTVSARTRQRSRLTRRSRSSGETFSPSLASSCLRRSRQAARTSGQTTMRLWKQRHGRPTGCSTRSEGSSNVPARWAYQCCRWHLKETGLTLTLLPRAAADGYPESALHRDLAPEEAGYPRVNRCG